MTHAKARATAAGSLCTKLMTNSAEIKRAINHNLGVEVITRLAMQQGIRNIRMDGIQKIFQGMTDLLQVNKVSA